MEAVFLQQGEDKEEEPEAEGDQEEEGVVGVGQGLEGGGEEGGQGRLTSVA